MALLWWLFFFLSGVIVRQFTHPREGSMWTCGTAAQWVVALVPKMLAGRQLFDASNSSSAPHMRPETPLSVIT